ncbi:MAG: serine protease, partial [Alphaproteobacteria bacterium]
IIVEKYGKRAGSGVLLDGKRILTAYHVIAGLEDEKNPIWIRLPGQAMYGLPTATRFVGADKDADIAYLMLEKPLPNPLPALGVVYGDGMYKDMPLFLAAYAHANPVGFGVVEGKLIAPAKVNGKSKVTANLIQLESRTYGGDSGGGVFTCDGDLAGIELGSMAQDGKPEMMVAALPGIVQILLRSFDANGKPQALPKLEVTKRPRNVNN